MKLFFEPLFLQSILNISTLEDFLLLRNVDPPAGADRTGRVNARPRDNFVPVAPALPRVSDLNGYYH